jgi:anthraniloyl-CoA monooxygenase
MKITVIGGGPGGLYFSILTKKAMPDCQIDVYERNGPDDSFGFGVVFSDETLGEFLKRDMQSYELIRSKFAYWDDIIMEMVFVVVLEKLFYNYYINVVKKKG